MNAWGTGLALTACLAAVFPGGAQAANPLESWRASADSFERFLTARAAAEWMREVSITSDGSVLTTAGDELTLSFWWEGAKWAGVSLQRGSGERLSMWNQAMPGRQAVVMMAVTPLGYQHVTPLRWVEITTQDGDDKTLFGSGRRTIRPAEAPEDPQAFWPNDRLLAWLDWQIVGGRRHRDEIDEKNHRTPSAVFLQVDFHGRVYRQTVPDAEAERCLSWRVYCNGRLVARDSAAGVRELDTARHGIGNYTVLAGIETPQGFFPISNCLIYTLAPQLEEGLQLAFAEFDYGIVSTYPEWYYAVLPPPQGKAPATYEEPEALRRARSIVAAWRGASWSGNTPAAPWIRSTPDLKDLRSKGRALRAAGPNLLDPNSDDDNDGLTLREEMGK